LVTDIVAETERLILRSWRPDDRAEFLAACNTDAVTRHLNGPASEEDIDAMLGRIAKCQEDRGFSFWAVERKADGALLGYCGLRICEDLERPVHGNVEIGWRLREDAWGQGYAREAAEATLEWAWRNLRCDRIVAITAAENRRSWGLMERLGMRRLRDLDFEHPDVPIGNKAKPHITYAIARPSAG
jgi:RimJ/RimL family protein N-acetyltransferase